MNFEDKIYTKASSDIKRIVLPETQDERTIKAASKISEFKIAKAVLLGNEEEIKGKYDYKLDGVEFVDIENYKKIESYVELLYELRKNKGMTKEKAKEYLRDPLYFAAVMLKIGDADGMVAGAANSTSKTLRPVLQVVKMAKGSEMVSAGYIICLDNKKFGEDGVMLYADTALVENPNERELAEIAVTSAKTYEKLVGAEPKVALLSYSTYGSAKSDMTQKVINATQLARKKAPEYLIDGEMQFDAAVIPEIGICKAPQSKVAGKANVLIFPDLNSGNIAYKITERMANARAYAITQGFAKPVSDLSRGCSAEDIVTVTAITAVLAQETGGETKG